MLTAGQRCLSCLKACDPHLSRKKPWEVHRSQPGRPPHLHGKPHRKLCGTLGRDAPFSRPPSKADASTPLPCTVRSVHEQWLPVGPLQQPQEKGQGLSWCLTDSETAAAGSADLPSQETDGTLRTVPACRSTPTLRGGPHGPRHRIAWRSGQGRAPQGGATLPGQAPSVASSGSWR